MKNELTVRALKMIEPTPILEAKMKNGSMHFLVVCVWAVCWLCSRREDEAYEKTEWEDRLQTRSTFPLPPPKTLANVCY